LWVGWDKNFYAVPTHGVLTNKACYVVSWSRKLHLIQPFKDRRILLVSLIVVLVVVEVFFAMLTESKYDMDIWFQTGMWMNNGINIYVPDNHLGYPPLWALWCSVSFSLYGLLGNNAELWRLIIKLPMIAAQFVLAFVVWKFAQKRFDPNVAWKVLFYTLPFGFFIYIGVLWGQINILSALLTFLAFYAVTNKRTTAGALLLGLAVTLKIYPLITLPAFLLFILKNQDKRRAGKFALYACTLPVAITLAIFAAYGWDIIYFLRTIFYWTPIFQTNPLQFQGGCMNAWSFLGLLGVDISTNAVLRFLWIPILGAAAVYWYRKPKMDAADLNLSLISFYVLFMVSYAWVSEQTFLDPLPFILLLILAFRPKRAYLYALTVVQLLVYIFTTFNGGTLIFEPLLARFYPVAIEPVRDFSIVNNSLFWTIRGTMGLVISAALVMFLLVLMKTDGWKLTLRRIKGAFRNFSKAVNRLA
jgi:Gpi18-like mannosyltransferase